MTNRKWLNLIQVEKFEIYRLAWWKIDEFRTTNIVIYIKFNLEKGEITVC